MRKHYPFRVRPVRRLAYGMTLGLLMAVSAPVPSVGAEHDAPTVISGEELLSVREVIGWIEENSRYIFIYRTDVDLDRQVSVELKVDDIPAVLDAMLAGTDLEYSIRGRQIIISRKVVPADAGKEKTVTGVVADAAGVPIIGANVTVKGVSGVGAITDVDGRFSIQVRTGSVLEISYLGFVTVDVTVGARDKLDVIMQEDTEMLDEIVVVGYGTQTKKTLTGAVSVMEMDDLETSTVSTMSHALAGKAAGLRVTQVSAKPGGGSTFNIRGAASTGAGNDPLFVIDGFPVTSTNTLSSGNIYTEGTTDNILSSINPDDIESITVLKDAASTAIYGARAGHGVILITTKRGREHKPRVTYSGAASVQIPRTNYRVLDTKMFMDMRNRQAYEEYLKSYGLDIYEGYVAKPADGVIPEFTPVYTNDQILNAEGTDWLDEVMRTGYLHQHNVSVNGGTDKTRYLASINYMNQEGIVKNNGFSRFSARVNLDQDFNKYISVGLNASYTQNSYDNVPLGDDVNEYSGVLTSAIQANPANPIYDENGDYYIDPMRSTVPNPVSLLEIQDKTVVDRLMASAFAVARPVDGLQVKLLLGADRSFQKRSSYLPSTTLQGSYNNGEANISQEEQTTYLMELTAQYERYFGDHYLKALGGYSFQKFVTAGVSAGNKDFITDAFGYNNLGYGAYAKPSVGSWASTSSIASTFFRVNYSYANRYLVEATLRADAASNFTPDNRWGLFPSVALGWLVNEENFMEGTEGWLSLMKLRASYGQTGNSNVGYRINDYYAVGNGTLIGGVNSSGVYAAGLGNPELTWETTSELNVGLDMAFLDSRISFTAEYFNRRITDLLVTNKPLPSYNEVSVIAANQGATQSQGFEFTLNTVNIRKSDFEWNTTLTLSHYNDRWLDRGPNWVSQPYQTETDPIRAWWSYEAEGILQPGEKAPAHQPDLVPGMMKLKDQNNDGLLNQYDMVYVDNGDPKIIYGLNNSIRWKNWDFNIYFYGEAGRKRGESYFEGWTRMDNGANVSTYSYNAFSSMNLTSKEPGYVRGGDGWGDYYVKSVYFIRCGNITLGYRIPVRKSICQNLRVYVDVTNPFVITNWTGLDPETDNGDYPYPNVTSFNLGLSVTF